MLSCELRASQRQEDDEQAHTEETQKHTHVIDTRTGEAEWKNRLRKLASSCIGEVERERGGVEAEWKKTREVKY